MKNIRHLDFFIENGINIGTYRVENGWGEAKTLTESVLNDFLLKIKGAFSYVVARTQLMQPNQIGFRNRIRSGKMSIKSVHKVFVADIIDLVVQTGHPNIGNCSCPITDCQSRN